MANLFGTFTTDSSARNKSRVSLLDMAREKFAGENELLNEITLYLQSRRQLHQYPSKISWEMQLQLLEKVPREQRASQVRNSTIKGYRAIAWDDNKSEDIGFKKSKPIDISSKAF